MATVRTKAQARATKALLAGAALAGIASSANAVTYTFNSGDFMPGTTAPNPLLSPDILNISTGANHFFNGVTFTNQSGIVNWNNGLIYLQGGSINNQAVFNALGDNTILSNGGTNLFTNSGVFRKSGGTGTTTISGIPFVNTGQIDAQTGTISFTGGAGTFNSGSSFTGAGVVALNGDTSFTGAISSQNLDFVGGTATANNAMLIGAADFRGGNLSGTWTVANNATLNVLTGSNHFFANGTTVNNGTIAWSAGITYLQSGTINNAALWDARSDDALLSNGGTNSFVNTGTFRKSAGTGVSSVGAINFVNNGGTIDAQTGIIRFNNGATFNSGTSFIGAGVVQTNSDTNFAGSIASSNLDLIGGTATGTAATLNGTADFLAGALSGGWTLASGTVLNGLGGSNKFLVTADVTNNGTIAWQEGTLYLQSGAELRNAGTFNLSTTNGIFYNGGATATVTNTGLFHVDSGFTGTIQNRFVNNGGTITADGIFTFTGSNAEFNTGTIFNGTGTNRIASSATFAGNIASGNLQFASGTYNGNAAVLSGTSTWNNDTFAGTWTVASGGTLTVATGSNKLWNGGVFTNNGTIDWREGAGFLSSAAQFVNNGLVDYGVSTSLNYNGGAATTVTNAASGTFHVDSGFTVALQNRFVNDAGTINADGIFNFTGNNALFNSGTTFNGAGSNRIVSNATFAGDVTSTNLVFQSGTYTGNAAVLHGTAAWTGDTFGGGTFTIGADGVLNVTGAGNKLFSGGTFTNAGLFSVQGGALFLSSSAIVSNSGTIDFTTDSSINYNGGAQPSFTNSGLITKTGGTGTATITDSLDFANTGTIDVRSGTIRLPTNFANAGTLTGSGTFAVSGTLTNNGTIAPGLGVGALGLTGNYVQTSLGSLAIQIGAGTLSDLFNVSGTASLNGGLSLFCTSCALTTGDTFTILDLVGDLTGSFANVATSGFLDGFAYNLIYDTAADRVQLVVTNPGVAAVPEPATWAMLIGGFGLTGGVLRRRARPMRVAA